MDLISIYFLNMNYFN